MIVATHLLSTLSYAHTHVDKGADGKEKEEVEGETDRLGPDQAQSMLALLAGHHLNCTL